MTNPAETAPKRLRDIFGHPPGLAVLFTTEMWERFSYFGNAALIVLYMVQYLLLPGRVEGVLGYGAVKAALEFLFGPLDVQPFASQLFGFYTGLAYSAPILGGLIADRLLGRRRTVIIGGLFMAAGHFMMTFESLFLVALTMLIIGIGTFKPNISIQVGELYAPKDSRRGRAYAIFYVGINIGAFLAPLVCGTLATVFGWHAGFAAAGVGMLISLSIYLWGLHTLPEDRPARRARAADKPRLTGEELRSIAALVLICLLVSLFWATYDQQGNTIVLWADEFTDRAIDLKLWRGEIPTPWFLALNPLMIFVFTPILVRRWTAQAARGTEPSPVAKMAFACLCVALGNLVMIGAALSIGPGDKAAPWWLVGYFAVVTVGELFLAPVGLALIATAAPERMRAMMMGVWFATTLPGDILAGWLGGFWSTMGKVQFYLMIAAIAVLAAAALGIASGTLRSVLAPKSD